MMGIALIALVGGKAEGGQEVLPLIPWPVEIERGTGQYVLAGGAQVCYGPGAQELADLMVAELEKTTGLKLASPAAADLGERVVVIGESATLPSNLSPPAFPEAYLLQVTADSVVLAGGDRAGLLWAFRTWQQLLHEEQGQWSSPAVFIRDYPRFPRRSLLLDPARNFLSLDALKRQVDLLSAFKFNVLHFHLTDDQGWRFESKAFPRLQEVGGEGRFYTQEQLRELVAYAQARGVTVMPEMDMPGHSTALLAAFPELSCSGKPVEVSHTVGIHPNALCPAKEEVYEFLQPLLAEVAAVFPSEFIHIGSDEVMATDWEQCPACDKLLAENSLEGKKGLHAYFLRRVSEIIVGLGKRTLAWDEVTEFAPAGVVIQAWRRQSWAEVAARQGREAVVSPILYTYVDYNRLLLPLRRCYSFDPVPAGLLPEEAKLILGGGANLWGEWATEDRLDLQLYPRLLALAEVYWSPPEQKNYPDFLLRLDQVRTKLEAQGVRFGDVNPAMVWDTVKLVGKGVQIAAGMLVK
ncbi:MAG: hypothetical protein A2V67_03575 [Deltaproteobacteria bacterium RBG_13_61_14]|nr:MAG: hypothetical protein A2V67_03575 [Deltaproteobacteria bacterium RBG_13_61_14]